MDYITEVEYRGHGEVQWGKIFRLIRDNEMALRNINRG